MWSVATSHSSAVLMIWIFIGSSRPRPLDLGTRYAAAGAGRSMRRHACGRPARPPRRASPATSLEPAASACPGTAPGSSGAGRPPAWRSPPSRPPATARRSSRAVGLERRQGPLIVDGAAAQVEQPSQLLPPPRNETSSVNGLRQHLAGHVLSRWALALLPLLPPPVQRGLRDLAQLADFPGQDFQGER